MTATRTLLYVRTPQGRAVAFTPDTKLSPALKAMLKAVDGKVTVAELVVQFADADAADLLGRLEVAGLIKLREDRSNDFQNNAAAPLANTPAALFADFALTDTGQLEPLLESAVANSPPATLPQSAGLNTGLALIVDVMSTFVLTYLPQQAFTVLAKLEGFKTLAELEAELPDYSVLAKASGPVGVVHLAELTERVREAAAA